MDVKWVFKNKFALFVQPKSISQIIVLLTVSYFFSLPEQDYRGDSNTVVFNPEQGFPVKEKLLATSDDTEAFLPTEPQVNSDETSPNSACLASGTVDLSPTAHHPLAPSPPLVSSPPDEYLPSGMGTILTASHESKQPPSLSLLPEKDGGCGNVR